MNREKLLLHLQDKLPGLLAVYLFGSHASGHAGPESDLDLSVLVVGKPDPLALWTLAGGLADIAGCAVDLVDLRAASTVLQYQIITTGERLWAKDSQAALYESFILSDYTKLNEARAALLNDVKKEGRIYDR